MLRLITRHLCADASGVRHGFLFALCACVVTLLAADGALAQTQPINRVSVRGVYYREASTRVIEPMVQVTTAVPKGFDVGATFLVDAVTSASVASGVTEDKVFTEFRKEAAFSLGYTHDDTRVAGAFRYSAEPDYYSRTIGLNVMQAVLEDTGALSLNAAYADDTVPVLSNGRMRTLFTGLFYTQALSPTWLLQAGYEAIFVRGTLENPYIRVPNKGRESPPRKRLRHVAAVRVAKYLPTLSLGLQLHYRAYYDQSAGVDRQPNAPEGNLWGIVAHTIEGRVYKMLSRDFEARLSYRYYTQGAAGFWCNTDAARGGRTDCYDPFDPFYSADVKWGQASTHVPEIKILWDLRIFSNVPLLKLFAPGTADISYGRYFQSTRFGAAHLLQVGYTYPL